MSLKWECLSLGDFAQVISGFAFKSKDFKSEGVPVIKIKNIRVGQVDMSDASYVDPAFLDRVGKKYRVKSGDILISLTGSHLTLPNSVVGRVALYSGKLGTSLLNQRAGKILVTRPDKVTSSFLLYVLYTEEIGKNIALMAHGSASQANVSPSQVESLKILLPPLPTQHKIAAILSAYDDLIENNNRRIEILEEMARMLYREWFVKFRYPGHESDRFYESELGLIPEGWEAKKLTELGFMARGKSKHRPRNDPSLYGGEYPFIQTGEVKSCLLYITDYEKTYNDKGLAQSKIWQPGTLLITIAANIAETAIITMPACFPDSIVGFVADSSQVTPEFLKYRIDDIKVQMQNFSRGTAQDNLSLEKIKLFDFLVPPKEHIQKYKKITQPAFEQIKNLQIKNNNLRQTRDLLLPRLISGEIDVENLDIKGINN